MSPSSPTDRFERLARGAGLISVVLLFIGVVVQGGESTPLLTDSVSKTTDYFSTGPGTADWAGQAVEVISFLVLIPFVAAVTSAIRARGGQTLGLTAFGAGLLYTGMSLTPGMAALGAAWYRAGHGFGGETAIALNDLRDVTFYLSLSVLAVFVGAVAVAVLKLDIAPRAYGWIAAVVAVLLLVPPVAPPAMLLGLVWMAAFSFALVRRAGSEAAPGARVAAGSPAAALTD
jgi:hypothetical protein